MRPIRILLVDDHHLMRAGLRKLAEASSFEVVGEAGDGREALGVLSRCRPDIVLMDISMPELNGLDATARIRAQFPNVRVIILSMSSNEEHVVEAFRAGASGYLLKNITPQELEQAVKDVHAGGKYITSAVAEHVIRGIVEGTAESPLARLTPRQREVLQLVAQGDTTKQIAKKLGISAKTVESHRTELMKALDIHDTAGLVRYAIRMGLISPDW